MALNPPSRSVVITGVSSGIGWGTAKALIARGYHVFGSVRKKEDADRVRTELGEGFTPLLFDVTDAPALAKARAQVEKTLAGAGLACLINNSGIGIGGPALDQPLDEFRRHFEVNVVGLLAVTREFAPLLGAQASPSALPGRILNISSVAGKLAPPFMGAYVASKHAVEGLSAVLRRELLFYGIDVIVVGPGAVNTPIWDKAAPSENPYKNSAYAAISERFSQYFISEGRKGYGIDDFGEKIARIVEARRPKTRYALVPHYFQRWVMPRLLPPRMVDRAIGKATGLLR